MRSALSESTLERANSSCSPALLQYRFGRACNCDYSARAADFREPKTAATATARECVFSFALVCLCILFFHASELASLIAHSELIERTECRDDQRFALFKCLPAHILPLTNCAFNKSGDKFITGSYDRTCKVWDTERGIELATLEGHKNVVYAIAFNNPYGDKIITGSFDKTCKVWSTETGEQLHTLRGHQKEIVCLAFSPQVRAVRFVDAQWRGVA